jgi:hypothetical protein
LGHLLVRVELSDLFDPELRVSAKLTSTYSALAELDRQLIALADGMADEAVLTDAS